MDEGGALLAAEAGGLAAEGEARDGLPRPPRAALPAPVVHTRALSAEAMRIEGSEQKPGRGGLVVSTKASESLLGVQIPRAPRQE